MNAEPTTFADGGGVFVDCRACDDGRCDATEPRRAVTPRCGAPDGSTRQRGPQTPVCAAELGVDLHRRSLAPGDFPLHVLSRLPVLGLLERLSIPVLAITVNGSIPFANTAFGHLLGYSRIDVQSMNFTDVLVDADRCYEPVLDYLRAHAGGNVDLLHCEGFVVHANLSTSALKPDVDSLALVTLNDVTEQWWTTKNS